MASSSKVASRATGSRFFAKPPVATSVARNLFSDASQGTVETKSDPLLFTSDREKVAIQDRQSPKQNDDTS